MTRKTPPGTPENELDELDELDAAYDHLDGLLKHRHAEGTNPALENAIAEAWTCLRERQNQRAGAVRRALESSVELLPSDLAALIEKAEAYALSETEPEGLCPISGCAAGSCVEWGHCFCEKRGESCCFCGAEAPFNAADNAAIDEVVESLRFRHMYGGPAMTLKEYLLKAPVKEVKALFSFGDIEDRVLAFAAARKAVCPVSGRAVNPCTESNHCFCETRGKNCCFCGAEARSEHEKQAKCGHCPCYPNYFECCLCGKRASVEGDCT